MIKLP